MSTTSPTAVTPLVDPDLRALLDLPLLPEARFLSLYLDARPDAQGKRHLEVFLGKEAKVTRPRVSAVRGDLLEYDRLIDRVRDYVQTADLDGVLGIAVFAEILPVRAETGGEKPFFEAFRLNVAVESRLILGRGPDLGPIIRALGRYAHYVAVRLDEATREAAREPRVDELHDRVHRDHYAVGGVERTLEALQEGKVERLIASRRFDAKGGRCERCGFLVGAGHAACPYCGGPLAEVPVLQYLVEKAEDQRAAVELVDEPDPKLDDELEGVGAFLRFQ